MKQHNWLNKRRNRTHFCVYILIIFFWFMFAALKNTEEIVTVAQVNGNVEYRSDNSWHRLSFGMKLPSNTWLRVSNGSFTLLKGDLFCHQEVKTLNIMINKLPFTEEPGVWHNAWTLFKKLFFESEQLHYPTVKKGGYCGDPMLVPTQGEVIPRTAQLHFWWLKDSRAFYHIEIETENAYGQYVLCRKDTVVDTTLTVPLAILKTADSRMPLRFRWTILPVDRNQEAIYRTFTYNHAETEALDTRIKSIESSAYLDPQMALTLKATEYEGKKLYMNAYQTYRDGVAKYPGSVWLFSVTQNFSKRMQTQITQP